MVKGDDKWEGAERNQRMQRLEARIGMTESGDRWLDRVAKIGRPDWSKSDSQQGELSVDTNIQDPESPDAGG